MELWVLCLNNTAMASQDSAFEMVFQKCRLLAVLLCTALNRRYM